MGPVRAGPGRGRHSPKESNLKSHRGVVSGRAPVGGAQGSSCEDGAPRWDCCPRRTAWWCASTGPLPTLGRVSASWGGGRNAALCSWAGSPRHRRTTPDAGLRAVPDSPVPGQADGGARPRLGMRGAPGTPQPAPRGQSPSSGSTTL